MVGNYEEYKEHYDRVVAVLERLHPGQNLDGQELVVEFIALMSTLFTRRPSSSARSEADSKEPT